MTTDFKLKLNRALADKRVQAGGALAIAGLAVVSIIGGASAWVINDRAKAQPDMADRAKLAIELQQPKPTSGPLGQLAVLDPNQIQPASTPPVALTPEMKALVDRDRRDQAQMVADQRAFDARIRSEMSGGYRADYQQPSAASQPPVMRVVSTPVAAAQLRLPAAPVLNRAREDGYQTPEDDSDRYEARRRAAQEERYYARDWRDRPPPPPPRRGRDDDEDGPD